MPSLVFYLLFKGNSVYPGLNVHILICENRFKISLFITTVLLPKCYDKSVNLLITVGASLTATDFVFAFVTCYFQACL